MRNVNCILFIFFAVLFFVSCSKEDARFVSAAQDVELRDDGSRASTIESIGPQLNLQNPTPGIYDPVPKSGNWEYIEYIFEPTDVIPGSHFYDTLSKTVNSLPPIYSNGFTWAVRDSEHPPVRYDNGYYLVDLPPPNNYYISEFMQDGDIIYHQLNGQMQVYPLNPSGNPIVYDTIYYGSATEVDELQLSINVQGVQYSDVIVLKSYVFETSTQFNYTIGQPKGTIRYKYYAPHVGLIKKEQHFVSGGIRNMELTGFVQ